MIALGPAVPVSRRSRIGVPVGVRANLSLALARGGYDVVHGFEPGLPSLSYLALRDAQALAVATFLSPERLGYPPGRAQRERLLGRIDALVATSEDTAQAAAERLPGDYRVVTPGVDLELFQPGGKRSLVVLEWRPGERALTRSVVRALSALSGAAFKVREDPRRTRVGRFLRRTSIDELPQLFNVLRGDMSLVGPRPEETGVVSGYSAWHFKRLMVKPGMTGPMQVNGRGDLSLDERVRLELTYIENYSILTDLKILLLTVPVVLTGKGSY